jgi:urease accessory protein
MMLKRTLATAGVLLAATAPAFAHVNPAEHGSFMAGFTHPLSGLDHIVVMVAVGLWAATIGGRALWVVPAAFVGMMTAGYGLALLGVQLPYAEPVILASIVALGLLIAAAVRLPVAVGALLVGVFALFHGYAHGGELGAATALPFGLGFAVATALLHSAGIGLGVMLGSGIGLREATGKVVARVLGGIAAAIGLVLAFGS